MCPSTALRGRRLFGFPGRSRPSKKLGRIAADSVVEPCPKIACLSIFRDFGEPRPSHTQHIHYTSQRHDRYDPEIVRTLNRILSRHRHRRSSSVCGRRAFTKVVTITRHGRFFFFSFLPNHPVHRYTLEDRRYRNYDDDSAEGQTGGRLTRGSGEYEGRRRVGRSVCFGRITLCVGDIKILQKKRRRRVGERHGARAVQDGGDINVESFRETIINVYPPPPANDTQPRRGV